MPLVSVGRFHSLASFTGVVAWARTRNRCPRASLAAPENGVGQFLGGSRTGGCGGSPTTGGDIRCGCSFNLRPPGCAQFGAKSLFEQIGRGPAHLRVGRVDRHHARCPVIQFKVWGGACAGPPERLYCARPARKRASMRRKSRWTPLKIRARKRAQVRRTGRQPCLVS